MATSKAQRIGIIIIAVVMTVGTLGSFFIMIVANKNASIDAREDEQKQKVFDKKVAAYQDELAKYQAEVDKEDKQLAPKYYDTVKQYESEAAPFDGSKVKELGKRDLQEGDGVEVKDPSDMRAYYIGWNEKGKIFDSSLDGDTLKPPFSPASAIPGWQKGVIGMKVGGVRELTIPSDLAYGKDGQGEDIPANAPLKFIIIAIPKSDLKQPEIPQDLLQGAQ
jgi:FKBP-type peptidyl-prolyl cis-trans isomerase FkpA